MNSKEQTANLPASFLLKHLKEETRHIHDQVEQRNLARLIVDHSITKEQYYVLISHNHQVYKSLESFLKEYEQVLPLSLQNLLNFDKSDALYKDLALIGDVRHVPSLVLKKNPVKMDLIGAMYVMEGSMLGGVLISNHLAACHNLAEIDQFYFFGKNTKKSLDRWKSFKVALESEEYSEQEINAAIGMAKEVFALFEIS